jgi:hypothetical protein
MEEPPVTPTAFVALAAAAALTLIVGIAHSWLGERLLLGPLLAPASRSGLLRDSRTARRILRFAWHLTTLAWWGLAAIFLALAGAPLTAATRHVLAVLALTFLLTGSVILLSSKGRHLAWPAFLAIAGAAAFPLL